ncbi:hypothetical protein EDB81DRAFT_671634, partial [Dactylonectria macrodidyma]
INYAVLLRPEKHLAVHIADCVDGFDWPRTSNKSTHGAFCFEMTGVLLLVICENWELHFGFRIAGRRAAPPLPIRQRQTHRPSYFVPRRLRSPSAVNLSWL